jgi:hypothetical protein
VIEPPCFIARLLSLARVVALQDANGGFFSDIESKSFPNDEQRIKDHPVSAERTRHGLIAGSGLIRERCMTRYSGLVQSAESQLGEGLSRGD